MEDGLDSVVHEVGKALEDPPLVDHGVHHARRGGRPFARVREDPRVIEGVKRFYERDLEAFGYEL